MDYEFENICKLNQTIVGEFFKVWNKQHNFFKKRILRTLILWTIVMLFWARYWGAVLTIIFYLVGLILFYVKISISNKKRIERHLKTYLKLYPGGEVHYIFENLQFGVINGKKYGYQIIDSVVFSEKLTCFSAEGASWFFPRDGFNSDNYEAFQEFIKGKIESNKIRYIKP